MCSSECAGQNSFSMGFASSLARCKIEEGSDESQLVKRKGKERCKAMRTGVQEVHLLNLARLNLDREVNLEIMERKNIA